VETGRSMPRALVALGLLCVIVGCPKSPEASPMQPVLEDSPPRFAILDEESRPILTAEQIVGYEWTTHSITLRPGAALNVRVKKGRSIVHGVPFSVVANGVICYRGVITGSFSSVTQSVPVINISPIPRGKKDVVQIELGYPRKYFKGKDPRGDERIRRALRSLGKLRGVNDGQMHTDEPLDCAADGSRAVGLAVS